MKIGIDKRNVLLLSYRGICVFTYHIHIQEMMTINMTKTRLLLLSGMFYTPMSFKKTECQISLFYFHEKF